MGTDVFSFTVPVTIKLFKLDLNTQKIGQKNVLLRVKLVCYLYALFFIFYSKTDGGKTDHAN